MLITSSSLIDKGRSIANYSRGQRDHRNDRGRWKFQNRRSGYNNVPSAIRFRSHASINRASLSSRHYWRRSLCVFVCGTRTWLLPYTTLADLTSRQDSGRARSREGENTCARLKSTPRPLLVCRNLLTRRLFALYPGTQPFSSFNRRENFRACNPRRPTRTVIIPDYRSSSFLKSAIGADRDPRRTGKSIRWRRSLVERIMVLVVEVAVAAATSDCGSGCTPYNRIPPREPFPFVTAYPRSLPPAVALRAVQHSTRVCI